MPQKKRGRPKGGNKSRGKKREIKYPEDTQVLCVFMKSLGSSEGKPRIKVLCSDNVERIGTLGNKFKKRIWVKSGSVMIADKSDYQDKNGNQYCDIVHIYFPHEIKSIKHYLDFASELIGNDEFQENEVSTKKYESNQPDRLLDFDSEEEYEEEESKIIGKDKFGNYIYAEE